MNTKLIWAVLVIVAVVAVGAYFYPQVATFVGSPTGSTFGDGKIAAVVMSPTSASATSSSILNSDGSDRIILDNFVTCAGATTTAFAQTATGLANWTWTAGTTSAANANLPTEPLAMNINVATGTYDAYTASSTYSQVSSRRWAAGSYLTFQVNGTTTPSISCVAAVRYTGS